MDPEPHSLMFALPALAVDFYLIFQFILLFVLLFCSALISGAEVALFSLSQIEINEAEESDSPAGKIVAKLLKNPKKLLATILIANNLINISTVLLFAVLGEFIFESITYEIFGFISLRQVLDVGVVTFLILLFGEILPKIYASRNNIKFSYFMAYPIYVLDILLSLLSVPMGNITTWMHKKFGKKKSNISVGQLSQALELASNEDTTNEEKKLLHGIVSFGNTETRQVMCPRIDIFALNENVSYKEALSAIIDNGYSRIPVYKENIDNVTGIIYVKDLLPYIDESDDFDWVSIKRKPFFVPEGKKLDDLMDEFQEKKIHLAVVVDEYGGTSGLITLEDIIEEIVGDISDEYDDEDIIFSKIDDDTFVFEGKTTLKDFYRVMEVSDEDEDLFEEQKGDAETIAGFVLEEAGNFPMKGSSIEFHKYVFTVEVLDKKRIKQIKIKRNA